MSQDVQLTWMNYEHQYILFLCLGVEDGKTYGLRADALSDHEVAAVRSRISQLNAVSLGRRIQWIKENCPNAYAKGFKTLHVSKGRPVNKWQVK